MNVNNNIDLFIKNGFQIVNKQKHKTILKNPESIFILNNDGSVEGFISNKNVNYLHENKTSIKNILRGLQGILIIGMTLTYFTTEITIVDGISMEPTLKNHQVIIKTKSMANIEKVQIGKNSIIKFIMPDGDFGIKRIVGVSGDTIEYKGAWVYINGKPLGESATVNLLQMQKAVKAKSTHIKPIVFKLKPNEYYVMGDNINNSVDSRDFGVIDYVNIVSVIQK